MTGKPDRPPDAASRPPRRPRYRGTHPRQFGERYKEQNPAAYPGVQEHVRAQGRTPAGTHVPVMPAEVLDLLDPRPGDIVADLTLGYGGHALLLLDRIVPGGHLYGMDHDGAEMERTRARLRKERPGAPFTGVHSHFAGLGKLQAEHRLPGFDVLFADLGVSSMQIDDPARGFSYKHDGPLDMRMDRRAPHTAADLIARLTEEELSILLDELADEPDHARIARRIVARRSESPMVRTRQLVSAIFEGKRITPEEWKATVAADPGARHPAARTFQALRMAVNDELGQLDHLLRIIPWCLNPGGRVGILSFHFGEDQRVRRAFEEGVAAGIYAAASNGPIRPLPAERRDNPRSASALFRWARRAPNPG